MKKIILIFLFTLIIIVSSNYSLFVKANSADKEKVICTATITDDFIDNEVLLVLKHNVSMEFINYTPESFNEINCLSITDITASLHEKIEKQLNGTYVGNMPININNFRRILKITLGFRSKQYVLDAIEILEKRDDIMSAEPVSLTKVEDFDTNNLLPKIRNREVTSQWALERINWEPTQLLSLGTRNIKIGIIDTGISNISAFLDQDHDPYNDILDADLSKDFDYTDNDRNPFSDQVGHGTNVASIIIANMSENSEFNSVCHTARLVSLKITYQEDEGDEIELNAEYFAEAITYATEHEIPILNISAGYYGTNLQQHNVIQSACGNYSGLMICAAGNHNRNTDNDNAHYPSSFPYDNIISVGATNESDQRIDYSNYSGSNYGAVSVDLFAPGENIYTIGKNGIYEYVTGTSFAAPYVTGVALLVWSLCPSLTPIEVKSIILNNVDSGNDLHQVNSLQGICVTNGRLNAYKAVSFIDQYAEHYSSNNMHTFTYTQYSLDKHIAICPCYEQRYESHTWEVLQNMPLKHICNKCELVVLGNPATGQFVEEEEEKQ